MWCLNELSLPCQFCEETSNVFRSPCKLNLRNIPHYIDPFLSCKSHLKWHQGRKIDTFSSNSNIWNTTSREDSKFKPNNRTTIKDCDTETALCFQTRRLRDRLVDSERYSLAIDVTGKCGLDASTVWFAWGISLLKSGDIMCAREHFAKCLTVSENFKVLLMRKYFTKVAHHNYNIPRTIDRPGAGFTSSNCARKSRCLLSWFRLWLAYSPLVG